MFGVVCLKFYSLEFEYNLFNPSILIKVSQHQLATMVSTIVLLTDPQQGDAKGMSPDEKRQIESDANVGLNKLKNEKYPPAKIENNVYTIDITCSGQSISPDCIFFAGDLTQFGGNYNINEQADWSINPSNCIGGTQLQYHRSLYDPQFPKQGVVQPTQCGPLYFGLGNHGTVNSDLLQTCQAQQSSTNNLSEHNS